ncbi:hypothetical protein Cfor_01923 [Coptotermes formosanus]|uniref:F-box domain-containing protein n=1 Tax=Coptotermes formosanus TaxID=36987 RepID=A0A6L2PTS3_COPFO|nr:hypothetical protein Cfor_01923 [Coptotermes formosanus]
MITPMKWDLLQALEDTLIDFVRQTAARWTERLYWAVSLSRKKWLRETQLLEEECGKFRADFLWLGSKPSEFINRAAKEVVQIIDKYDRNNGLHLTTTADKEIHKHICRCMLEAALFPTITDWHIKNDTSEFTKELMVLLFPCLPNMKCLRVAEDMPSRCSWLLANNIRMLNHLQEFYFPIGCSRHVLIELGKHCKQLKRLSVMSSKHVDDSSVNHLLKLRNLVFLNVDGTHVTPKGYSRLLCNLPKLRNITWANRVDDVLLNITKDEIQTVKSLIGTVRNALTIVLKCPFITHLSLFAVKDNLSDLKELNAVTEFTLVDCDSDIGNLAEVLHGIGPKLKELDLSNVTNVSIRDVTKCCTHLEILSLDCCKFTQSGEKPFDPQLPHFQNLASLELRANRWYGDFHSYLRSYVNLKVLTARCIPDLDDVAVVSVLQSNGFQNLKEFSAQDCGFLSMISVSLLVENCGNLHLLKGVGTWSGIQKEDMPEVYRKASYADVPITVVP